VAPPSSSIVAGTRTIRTSVASTRTAVARPRPNSFSTRIGSLMMKDPNTQTMIAAAAVITRAVAASPSGTAVALSPVRRNSSRMRESRNTS